MSSSTPRGGNKGARAMYQPIGGVAVTGDYYDDNSLPVGVDVIYDEDHKYGAYETPYDDNHSDDVSRHPYIHAARNHNGELDREYCSCGQRCTCCACHSRKGCVITTLTITLFMYV